MDQLCDYFKRTYRESYVTCDNGQSLLFIADKRTFQIKLCLYTIKADYSPNENDDNIIKSAVNIVLPSIVSNPVYIIANRLAEKLNVKFVPVYFPGQIPDNIEESHPPKFVITNINGSKQAIKDESEFQNGLHRLIGVEPNNVQPKAVNKSVADFFHEWSRNNLPSGEAGITKCDLDGMFIDSCHNPLVLIESKRSNTVSASDWKPYTKDFTGLHLLFNVASASDAQFWVIHHGTMRDALELNKDFQFSFFKITGFNTNGEPLYESKKPVSMEFIEGILNLILE